MADSHEHHGCYFNYEYAASVYYNWHQQVGKEIEADKIDDSVEIDRRFTEKCAKELGVSRENAQDIAHAIFHIFKTDINELGRQIFEENQGQQVPEKFQDMADGELESTIATAMLLGAMLATGQVSFDPEPWKDHMTGQLQLEELEKYVNDPNNKLAEEKKRGESEET